MSAAEVYERVRAAVCRFHGFGSDEELEQHVRAIVLTVIELRAKRAA